MLSSSRTSGPHREDDGEGHVEQLQPAAQRGGAAAGAAGELGGQLGLGGVDGEVLRRTVITLSRRIRDGTGQGGASE